MGITAVVKGIHAWRTATVGMTAAQKLLNLALASNPIGLIVTAVTLAITSLVLLYKHNKKFKEFVDNMFKAAKKAFDKIFKVTKEIFGKIIDFFKKDWKQSPFYLLLIQLLGLLL